MIPSIKANNIAYNASSNVIGSPIEMSSVTDLLGYLKEGPSNTKLPKYRAYRSG
jgi:hypothetical protein